MEFPDTFVVNNYIKSPKKYDVGDLIKFIGTKILGYESAMITVSYNDKILGKLSQGDYDMEALLDKVSDHMYHLMIKTRTTASLSDIICHEMKHFDQYEKGDLKEVDTESGKAFMWKGEIYPRDMYYADRPWEIEARSSQYGFWKQFKKQYLKQKKEPV